MGGLTGALLPLPFGLVNLAGRCCYLTPKKNLPAHMRNGCIAGGDENLAGTLLFLDCEKYLPAHMRSDCIAGAGELLLLLVLRDAKPV